MYKLRGVARLVMTLTRFGWLVKPNGLSSTFPRTSWSRANQPDCLVDSNIDQRPITGFIWIFDMTNDNMIDGSFAERLDSRRFQASLW